MKKDLIILTIKDETSILSFKEIKNVYNEECYFISRFYNGNIMKLDAALKEAFYDSCSSIIISKIFAIIKEEAEIGQTNIYFIQA